jgi:hypothetical protein
MPFSESLKTDIRRRSDMCCCLCHNIGVEIHHIIPEANGGPDIEENAAPLCPTCHETYGANPTKRKFIREARDNWLEVCAQRFSASDISSGVLIELASKLVTKEDLTAANQGLLSELSKLLPSSGPRGERNGQSLGQILAFFYDFHPDPQKARKDDIQDLYDITWGKHDITWGQSLSWKGSDEVKNQFIESFGRETVLRLCAYELSQHPYGIFRGGFTVEDFAHLVNGLITMMMLLLHHDMLGLAIDNEGQMWAWILADRPEAKQA